MSADGAWVFYKLGSDDGGAMDKLMRIPINGGTSQEVLTAHLDGLPRCSRSPGTLCAIAERSADRKQLVFSSFDAKGRGREVAKFDTEVTTDYRWDLSPDGTRLAVVKSREAQVHILSLTGRPRQDLTVKGWSILTTAAWASDGKSLFVSSFGDKGPVILHVDLQGNARLLWEQPGGIDTYAVPSPDGRHLALRAWTVEGNLWMMENF